MLLNFVVLATVAAAVAALSFRRGAGASGCDDFDGAWAAHCRLSGTGGTGGRCEAVKLIVPKCQLCSCCCTLCVAEGSRLANAAIWSGVEVPFRLQLTP